MSLVDQAESSSAAAAAALLGSVKRAIKDVSIINTDSVALMPSGSFKAGPQGGIEHGERPVCTCVVRSSRLPKLAEKCCHFRQG